VVYNSGMRKALEWVLNEEARARGHEQIIAVKGHKQARARHEQARARGHEQLISVKRVTRIYLALRTS